jgi:uncharacterized lipoprotein YehR (DUF1307 family)
MNKALMFVMAVVLALSVAACSGPMQSEQVERGNENVQGAE